MECGRWGLEGITAREFVLGSSESPVGVKIDVVSYQGNARRENKQLTEDRGTEVEMKLMPHRSNTVQLTPHHPGKRNQTRTQCKTSRKPNTGPLFAVDRYDL